MANENTNSLPPEVQKMLSEQLRDVHLPETISWWPLAWGWWVLITVLVLATATSSYFIYKNRAKNQYRKLATSSLKQSYESWKLSNNKQDYLHAANDVLKRCVLHNKQHSSLATLTGHAWITQLNQWAKSPLSEMATNALAFECYRANPESDIDALHTELIRWLETHQTDSIKGGQHA